MTWKKNIALGPPKTISTWRKIAVNSWKIPRDPSIYSIVEIDVTHTLQYIENLRKESGVHITLSHFFGKALATVFKEHPEINSMVRKNKIYPRTSVDIFFQVALDEKGEELSGIVIRHADQKSIVEIAEELNQQVQNLRNQEDEYFVKIKKTFELLPARLISPVMRLNELILYQLNLWHPLFGPPRDAFGSGMITNIGSLGIEMAFVPFSPFARVPLILSLGSVKKRPVVKNNKLMIAPTVQACFTLDHRAVDGVQASRMMESFKSIFSKSQSY